MIIRQEREKFFILTASRFMTNWSNTFDSAYQFNFFELSSYEGFMGYIYLNEDRKYFDYNGTYILLKVPTLITIQGHLRIKSALTTPNTIYLTGAIPFDVKVDINNTTFTDFYFNVQMISGGNLITPNLLSQAVFPPYEHIIIEANNFSGFTVIGESLTGSRDDNIGLV